MAINQEIISTSWEGQQKSYIEAGLKSLLQQMLGLLEGPLAANSVGSNQLTQELRDVINSIGSKVPTSRTVNGKALSSNITLSQSDIPGLVAALAGKISGIKANGASTTLPVDQDGVVELPPAGSTISPATAAPSMDGTAGVGSSDKYAREDHVHPHDTTKLSKSDVSVETRGDGTVDINVGSGSNKDTYTINLNHTHEGMAKLEKFVASNPPASMANDTIYVQVDSLTTPTEIESLWLFGLEFAGGVVPDTGEPMIVSPSNGSTLNLGDNSAGSGVSKTITVKGKHLTGDLTVAVGTGLTISYGQSTGQSSVTIPMAQALLGAQVTIAFSGSGSLDDGSLVISQGNDVLSVVVVVVVAELPNGYTRLEYVDNAVRGIDTGILATDSQDLSQSVEGSSWEVDVKYDSLPSSNQMVVVGNEDVAHWGGYINAVQKFGLGNDYAFSAAATVRQVITFTFWSNKITATSNGQTFSRNYTYQNRRSVCLFNNINAGVPQYAGLQFTGRIYSAKCTSGGSFNGIPAKRNSDNHFGLYDIENNVFYDLSVSA